MFIHRVVQMFGRIVLGLVIMVLGGGMAFYSAQLVELFGRSRWAEEHLGGSRQLWVLIGFITVVIGGLFMFGVVSFTSPTDMGTATFG